MAAVRHRGFWNSIFLKVGAVRRHILHYRTKFSKDWFSRWGDIAIFSDFQDGGRRHLEFSKIRNFNGLSPVGFQFASSCQILSKSVKQLLRYDDLTVFSKWRPSAILDLSGAYWDHPRRLLGGLYRCAKFGWNRCSIFDNMKLLIIRAFGLKTLIHAPKICFFLGGGFDSLSREQY